MKKILVPTDFSSLSKKAVFYATRLAEKLDAEIILLHVMNIHSTSETLLKWKRLEEEMSKIAEEDARQLIEEVEGERNGGVKIVYRQIGGFPFYSVIEHFVTDNGIDLVVMGTKGASGLKKVLMGSNTAAVIDNSSVPVIAVPEHTGLNHVKKIVYATNMVQLKNEIKAIVAFARLFNAEVYVLHVLGADSAKGFNCEKISTELMLLTAYPKISFHIARSYHIAEEVDAFVLGLNADILTMFTHKLHFFEKLFGNSITRQLTFHNQVPILTFNKTMLLKKDADEYALTNMLID